MNERAALREAWERDPRWLPAMRRADAAVIKRLDEAAEFDRAVCASKLYSAQCVTTAANLAWLMAGSLKRRTSAYTCPHCRQFHVSAHRLDGPNAVLCSWPGAR